MVTAQTLIDGEEGEEEREKFFVCFLNSSKLIFLPADQVLRFTRDVFQ